MSKLVLEFMGGIWAWWRLAIIAVEHLSQRGRKNPAQSPPAPEAPAVESSSPLAAPVCSLDWVGVPTPVPEERHVPEPAPPRKQRHIGELLDSLDAIMAMMENCCRGASWTHWETRLALKRMGPLVLNDTAGYPLDGHVHGDLSRIPFLGCVFLSDERATSEQEWTRENFIYWQRFAHCPAYVQSTHEMVLECGSGTECDRKKMHWVNFFVAVSPDGRVRPLKWQVDETVTIRPRRGGGWSRGSYTLRAWKYSDVLTEKRRCEGGDTVEGEAAMEKVCALIAWALSAALARKDYWSVAVRGRARATFLIPDNDAKAYFKNRKREAAVMKGGRLRPIIHFVESHDRITPSGKRTRVKEHIRGIRKFVWRDWEVSVNAPRWHFTADKFNVGAVDVAEEEAQKGGYIEAQEIVGRVINAEEDGHLGSWPRDEKTNQAGQM